MCSILFASEWLQSLPTRKTAEALTSHRISQDFHITEMFDGKKSLPWKGAFAWSDLHGSRSDTVHSRVSKENQQAFKGEFAMISTWKALKLLCKLFSCQLCRPFCSRAWRRKLSRHQDNCLENCLVNHEKALKVSWEESDVCWRVHKCNVYFQCRKVSRDIKCCQHSCWVKFLLHSCLLQDTQKSTWKCFLKASKAFVRGLTCTELEFYFIHVMNNLITSSVVKATARNVCKPKTRVIQLLNPKK